MTTDTENYAVVQNGGKQYFITAGSSLELDSAGLSSIDKVLLVKDDGKLVIGSPFVSGAKAEIAFKREKKAPKVISFKKKRRKGYRRKIGHRQKYYVYEVKKIISG